MNSQYKPLSGSSYVPLPDTIQLTKPCINIKHEDNECFNFCARCAVYDIIQKDIQLKFSEKRGDGEIWSRWVDIESSTKFGNVIVYNVGTCDTHTASLNMEEDSASAQFINSQEELNKLLENYFENF